MNMKKILLIAIFSAFTWLANANLYINIRLVLEDETTVVYYNNFGWLTSGDVNFNFSNYMRTWDDDDPTRKFVPLRWLDGYEWQENAARTFTQSQQNETFTLVVAVRKISITLNVDESKGSATLDHLDGLYAVDSTYTATATPLPGFRLLYWKIWDSDENGQPNEYPTTNESLLTNPFVWTIVGSYEGYSICPLYTRIWSPMLTGVVDIWDNELVLEPVFEAIPADADLCQLSIQTSPAGGIFPYTADITCPAGEKLWISAADVKWTDGEERIFTGWTDGSKDLYRCIETASGAQTFTAQFTLASEAPDTEFEVSVRGTNNKGIVAHNGIIESGNAYFLNPHYGDIIYLQALAESGYKLDSWSDGYTSYPRMVVVTEDADYKATFVEALSTITVISADKETGLTTDGGIFHAEEIVDIEALPADGYRFDHWEYTEILNGQRYTQPVPEERDFFYTTELLDEGLIGNRTFDIYGQFASSSYENIQNPSIVRVPSEYDMEVKAYFEALPAGVPFHSVKLQREDRGDDKVTVMLFGANNYLEGEQAVVFALTSIYYSDQALCALFKGWSDGSWDALRFINISQDTTLTALWEPYNGNFSSLPKHKLTINTADENGVVAGSNANAREGDLSHIEAQAKEGYEFDHWSDGSTQAYRLLTVLHDTTITAYFKPAEPRYDLTVMAAIPEQGKVVGSGRYKAGEEVLIYAVPAEGYEFLQWNDGNTNASRTVTVSDIAAQNIYVASFLDKQTTGVERTTLSTKAVKFMRNGQVFILRDGHVYNVLGIEIQ